MSIRLELPPNLESELLTEASQFNMHLNEYILQVLSTRQILTNQPKTGQELIAYWQSIGVINSTSEISDSQVYARHLRSQAENRTREQ